MSVLAIIGYALGGVVVLGALAGFFLSFWQPAPKRGEFSDPGWQGSSHPTDDGHGSHQG